MAQPVLPDHELYRMLTAVREAGGVSAAARVLNMPRATLQSRMRVVAARGLEREMPRRMSDDVQVAPAPDASEPIEALLERKRAGMSRAQAFEDWAKLIDVQVQRDGPIGVLMVGDIHVDDDHCDIARLEADLNAVRRTPGFYAGHLGDLTNNWVGRLAQLYAHQSTTFGDALRLAQWALELAPNLFVVNGNHDCHSADTEALTRRGWVKGPDVREDDIVATMNADGTIEWQTVQCKILRKHSGPMVQIKSNSISALVTPNHRVLHRVRARVDDRSPLVYAPADSLPKQFAIPVSGVDSAPGIPFSDDHLRLVGWVLTDGCMPATNRVEIYQSKEHDEIENVLGALGIPFTMSTRVRDITHICGKELKKPPLPERRYRLESGAAAMLHQLIPGKKFPAWASFLSARQFDVLLDAMIAGDGTWDGGDPSAKNVAVLHKTKEFLEAVQAVAVVKGWYARLSVAREKDYRLNLCRRTDLKVNRVDVVSQVEYEGDVWCLTVPNGNFMVRREGAAHFSGNCWNNGNDLLRFILNAGIHQSHGARMALRWPTGKEIRIHARHTFPGRSQYSKTHGMKREVLFGHRDHIIVAGHIHCDEARIEPALDGSAHWFLQVSGYKVIDEYAKTHHFNGGRLASSVAVVIDPEARVAADVVKPFWDVDTAADYLQFMQRKTRK